MNVLLLVLLGRISADVAPVSVALLFSRHRPELVDRYLFIQYNYIISNTINRARLHHSLFGRYMLVYLGETKA
jgi:hypothetical protein